MMKVAPMAGKKYINLKLRLSLHKDDLAVSLQTTKCSALATNLKIIIQYQILGFGDQIELIRQCDILNTLYL